MTNFETFLKQLLANPSKETTISINGKKRKIAGMAEFVTVQYPDDPYIKIVFQDRSFLMIVRKEKEFYFEEKLIGQITEIADESIGKVKIIRYKGQDYKLGTINDYQFCIKRYVGDHRDIEGECRFSDYFPVDGSKEYLSLGWTTFDDMRSDINCKLINSSAVDFIN